MGLKQQPKCIDKTCRFCDDDTCEDWEEKECGS